MIGTKEFVAWLPIQLGLGAGDAVVYPGRGLPHLRQAGVRLAGATQAPVDTLELVAGAAGPDGTALGGPRLLWVNSPSNPTGQVGAHRRPARGRGLGPGAGDGPGVRRVLRRTGLPDTAPVSVLRPDVSGGRHDGLLAVHSLSKRSNLAGYRAGFVTGDPGLIAELHEIRRHAGMIMPAPVQAAMVAALDDDAHADEQRARYFARRAVLRPALTGAGWEVQHSEAGLYLWASRAGADGWASARILAKRHPRLARRSPRHACRI